jgi:oxygen-independent coproporphyrinogen-3 oxidase
MCNFRIDTAQVTQRFNVPFADYFREELDRLKQFIDDGLLEREGAVLAVTPVGKIFVRNIAMVFDAYLKSDRKSGGKTQFSRTI